MEPRDDPLQDQVTTVVATLLKTTPEELSVDPDGDIGIRSGSAMVFVRVRDNPPLIDVFSPVLTEIHPSERLYAKLSDLTNKMPIGRLYCTGDTVWASVPVFGRDFQPSHLMLAVQVMTGLADELDDRLQGEFRARLYDTPGGPAQPLQAPASPGTVGSVPISWLPQFYGADHLLWHPSAGQPGPQNGFHITDLQGGHDEFVPATFRIGNSKIIANADDVTGRSMWMTVPVQPVSKSGVTVSDVVAG